LYADKLTGNPIVALIAGCAITFLVTAFVFGKFKSSEMRGDSFADCILSNMGKARTNQGVNLIRISCKQLHPD